MSDIPTFPYALLWGERTLRSVANLTRSRSLGRRLPGLLPRCLHLVGALAHSSRTALD